ncbi:AraD1 family protein [Nevskia soli]|uniref:AraD1 family protein n=1 Tax=Nevskia soli TaxID=418856 RepID=UPI0015D7EF43|nr:AraD1 family protein [Nevskia soli]
MRLVQITHRIEGARLAVVENDESLRLLKGFKSTYDLASLAAQRNSPIDNVITEDLSDDRFDYDEIYEGRSEWSLDVPFTRFDHPALCTVSGTGLTHKASAENRAKMHQEQTSEVTDSMRMYQWGLEGGSPAPGEIGVQPEWFYKGDGCILRAHGEVLTVPAFAEDGGEEPEIAGLYLVDDDCVPWRVGFAIGNEFSDHQMERKNYLYLAPSKLRECAIGPELITDAEFDNVEGTVAAERDGKVFWSARIFTGEKNMSHTLANLEHHHFKYPQHRRAGHVHIHFLGADAFSFGEGVQLQDGDEMVVAWSGFGRPLRNRLRKETEPERLVEVRTLGRR